MLRMLRGLCALLLCAILTAPVISHGAEADGKIRYPEATDFAEVQSSINDARAQASETGRLLMVILGADWCHDSRAFINFLDNSDFAALIDERYVVQRVNVGFYDHVRDVVQLWNLPIIYGTPTVIIEEPNSGVILNQETLPFWRNADALGAEAAVRYFAAFEPGPPTPTETPSEALAAALADIDAFEQAQAERIYLAYAELGAMIKAMGDERPNPAFNEKWKNLAEMRGAITEDLADLRSAAHAFDAAGETNIELDYPDYTLFVD